MGKESLQREVERLRDWQSRAAAKLREIEADLNGDEDGGHTTDGWWGEVQQLLREADAPAAGDWPWQWMLARWNEMVDRLGEHGGPRRMQAWTDERRRHARARIEGDPRQAWEAACAMVEASPFLSRRCRDAGTWRPDVDWLLGPGAWAKLHEGKYAEEREVRDPDGGESTLDARRTSAEAGRQHAARMARYGQQRVPRSELAGAPAAPAPRRKYEDGPVEGDE